MQSSLRFILIAALLSVVSTLHAADSGLRITCEGSDVGAEVWINGKFRGECPVDLKVPAGALKLLVRKQVDADREQVFQQDIRMGEDSIKKVEVQLPAPRLTAEGQAARIKAEQDEQNRKLAAESQRAQRIAASLAIFREAGVEPGNGHSLAECSDCPELVLVTGPANDIFAVGKYEVTVAQFAAFAKATNYVVDGGCTVFQGGWFTNLAELWKNDATKSWEKPGFSQTEAHPVVCVSEIDALAYLRWLSSKTGQLYQLPNVAQWQAFNVPATKGGAKPWTPQENNNHPACGFGNFHDRTSDRALSVGLGDPYDCSDGFVYTAPVGSFQKNAFGIYDLWGNAAELLAGREKNSALPGLEYVSAAGMSWSMGGKYGTGNYIVYDSYLIPKHRKQNIGFRVIRLI